MVLYYLTLLLIPFYKHPLVSYNVGGMTLIKVIGGGAFLYALAAYTRPRAQATVRSRSYGIFILFIVYLCLSQLANRASFNAIAFVRVTNILLFAVTTLVLVDTRKKLLWSCVFLLLAMDIAAAFMGKEFLQYGARYQGFRPGGIFGDANYYSASAIAVLPVAYYLAKGTADKWLSRFCLGSMIATVGGLVLGQSRGGAVGLAAVLLIIVACGKHRLRNAIVLAAVAVVVVMFFLPDSLVRRFTEESASARISTQERKAVLNAGLNMVGDKPLIGVGLGNFKAASTGYGDLKSSKMAHNSYLELAAENGLPALALFLLVCMAVMRDVVVAARLHSEDAVTRGILQAIGMGMIGFLIAAVFLSAEFEKMFWVLCFLVMASLRIEPAESPAESSDTFLDEPFAPVANEVVLQGT
jgi:O-antigen ligase